MVTRILIDKSPAFSHIELDLYKGFNVISGISGSGKSVFLYAMLSAFGLKESHAALVEVSLTLQLKELGICLEDFGIAEEFDDEIIISVLKKQNARYFINNQAISKKKLGEIANHFIKYISIKDGNELENEYMIHILNSLLIQQDSKFSEILQDYSKTFIEHKQCKIKLQEIEEMQRNIESLKDFAQFEIDKITKVQPQVGEYERLMHDKKLLSKREKVMETCDKALQELDNLDSVHKALELLGIDNTTFLSSIMEARGHIENGLHEFNSLDMDIESLLERISMLADIIRKYGSEEEALKHLAMQQQKLQEYESVEFDKTKLEAQFTQLTQRLESLANILHEKRKECLPKFVEKINYYAKELKLESVGIDQIQTECYQHGIDTLQIHLASKQKSVLSSGEYNRMRLAMLCVAADCNTCNGGVLILDEIDANLSGEESEGVAKLLQFLSKHYQVFAISHQPFMPLLCDKHYLVSKDSENTSMIKPLNKKERIKEVARMISGSKLDQHALSYAEKLLKQQQEG
ncbi:DNA repair protein RecN [Helicobacter trogontum]|uniref:DNA repair protein RecN n=1 Tax=Helicobacter trogontum TaxID=50960 RepID=A0A4U8TED0_9HELI|nr:hypothetical protein [Helicobacter trogontum]TLD98385.1 DNA recombination protein RecN [Helicobacter trogontum]